MGCCVSSPTASLETQSARDTHTRSNGGSGSTHTPTPTQSRVDFGHDVRWTANEGAVGRSELHRRRDAFWETAATYDGQAETWLALRMACESTDVPLACAILASAGLTVPSGRIADGAYDERGARYVVPQYCLSMPDNLADDAAVCGKRSASFADDGLFDVGTAVSVSVAAQGPASLASLGSPGSEAGVTEAATDNAQTLTLRLSTGATVELYVGRSVTVAQIEQMLRAAGHVPARTRYVRFFFLGRMLGPSATPLLDHALALSPSSVVQVMFIN
ncbi:hypothetical protein LPJ73_001947 [Coemansia sp. RSA 2703]|nr:hypothetical protein LPJ73_001947 [Coemansia sp. RSA 2703]KAJ2366732.1 hypothetical protein IW150_005864 [Coemansia sp. RSA 2607]KAJ2387286.1 hypothetical protein GGI05_004131 [Coemansia sp. RSA 2603]